MDRMTKKTGPKKPKNLYSFRIPHGMEEILSNMPYQKSLIVEDLLEKSHGACPLCKGKWPLAEEGVPMGRVGIRINEATHNKISHLPSAYVRAWLMVGLGYCPVCGQMQTKKFLENFR